MHVDNLILEITRKCNLKCDHCLRGNAQNKSMSQAVMQQLFSHVTSCNSLTIGGGEPSLAIEQLRELYQILCWQNVDVGSVFSVTNGKRIRMDLLRQFKRIYDLCTDNDASGFCISNDHFHQEARGFHRHVYDYEDMWYHQPENTCDFNFFEIPIREHTKTDTYQSGHGILARGRAKDWGERTEPYLDCLKFTDLNTQAAIEGEMYVCYNGDVVGDANMAYNDMKRYVVGNVSDWDTLLTNIGYSTMNNYHWCKEHCNSWASCYETLGPQIDALELQEGQYGEAKNQRL